jgi:hypothetical protein
LVLAQVRLFRRVGEVVSRSKQCRAAVTDSLTLCCLHLACPNICALMLLMLLLFLLLLLHLLLPMVASGAACAC